MLDNKESFNKVGISRNDEPTRFLTEEEMEQLEQARFNYETKVENTPKTTVEKNNKIKIEDIAGTIESYALSQIEILNIKLDKIKRNKKK